MKCEVCSKSVQTHPQGCTLWRINPLGETGVWRCWEHLSPEQRAAIDPSVLTITNAIEIPTFDEDQLETFEGKPHFLHSDTCGGWCDYACNGQKGFDLAERIAAQRK